MRPQSALGLNEWNERMKEFFCEMLLSLSRFHVLCPVLKSKPTIAIKLMKLPINQRRIGILLVYVWRGGDDACVGSSWLVGSAATGNRPNEIFEVKPAISQRKMEQNR